MGRLTTSNGGEYVVNGATRLKSRLLRGFGWTVAHVSFFDWDHRSESERRQLVVAKLAELAPAVAIEETVAANDDPSVEAIAETDAKGDDHGPVAADVVLSDEEDSDLMTPEPTPRPVTPVIAHELKVTENAPAHFEDTPLTSTTTTRANRRRKGRRKAKSPAPRAWRQIAVAFVLAASLGSYAVCMAYFLAVRWRQNVGIPMAAVVASMDQPRDVLGAPGISEL